MDLLKPREAAARIRVGRTTFYRLLKSGVIPVVRPTARTLRIDVAELDAFLRERSSKPTRSSVA